MRIHTDIREAAIIARRDRLARQHRGEYARPAGTWRKLRPLDCGVPHCTRCHERHGVSTDRGRIIRQAIAYSID